MLQRREWTRAQAGSHANRRFVVHFVSGAASDCRGLWQVGPAIIFKTGATAQLVWRLCSFLDLRGFACLPFRGNFRCFRVSTVFFLLVPGFGRASKTPFHYDVSWNANAGQVDGLALLVRFVGDQGGVGCPPETHRQREVCLGRASRISGLLKSRVAAES